ncbi:MAG: SDR family NAD(P)-dependent oxidoreductase, partial [Candidatus Binatia bacterium]
MELNGKIVLVTGAGRGIGKALALGFARAGAQVVLASRTLTEIEAAAVEIQAVGAQSLAIYADISQPRDVRKMAEQI